jgi:hypothetical protein
VYEKIQILCRADVSVQADRESAGDSIPDFRAAKRAHDAVEFQIQGHALSSVESNEARCNLSVVLGLVMAEHEHHGHHEHWKPQRGIRDYLPLIVIVLIAILTAVALQWGQGRLEARMWMRYFMGIFLVIFAMLKLFDLAGFADGFQMYDLIAKRFRPYALAYPFIELLLGLASLAGVFPMLTNLVLLVIMVIGAMGVFDALRKGLDVACACLGTVLKVPLSTVAVIEDVGMATMAALMLLLGGTG